MMSHLHTGAPKFQRYWMMVVTFYFPQNANELSWKWAPVSKGKIKNFKWHKLWTQTHNAVLPVITSMWCCCHLFTRLPADVTAVINLLSTATHFLPLFGSLTGKTSWNQSQAALQQHPSRLNRVQFFLSESYFLTSLFVSFSDFPLQLPFDYFPQCHFLFSILLLQSCFTIFIKTIVPKQRTNVNFKKSL